MGTLPGNNKPLLRCIRLLLSIRVDSVDADSNDKHPSVLLNEVSQVQMLINISNCIHPRNQHENQLNALKRIGSYLA